MAAGDISPVMAGFITPAPQVLAQKKGKAAVAAETTAQRKKMITNPVFILAVIALILGVVSYWPGAPTLGVAVILLAVAILIQVGKHL
jgi:hypothetical protein